MAKLDVCIDPLFPELSFEEKIVKTKECGYDAIEFWFWDHHFDGNTLIPQKKDIDRLASIMKNEGVILNDIVVNSPDGSIGGFLNKPEDREKYLERLKETIDVAQRMGCNKMITCTGNEIPNVSKETQVNTVVETLQDAAEIAEKAGVILVLEPLNTLVDHAGYLVDSSKVGLDIVKKVNSKGLRLLYDVYHMQIMEGYHIDTIRENIEWIGHFHSAGVPGRNELYNGEINYPNIITEIYKTNYDGYFGLEYWPTIDSKESLIKTKRYLNK